MASDGAAGGAREVGATPTLPTRERRRGPGVRVVRHPDARPPGACAADGLGAV